MRRFMHIIVLLALYNICGFCLKYSLLFPAVVTGVIFLISAWIGMFVALTRIILNLIEACFPEKQIVYND